MKRNLQSDHRKKKSNQSKRKKRKRNKEAIHWEPGFLALFQTSQRNRMKTKLSDRKLRSRMAETVMKRYLASIRPSLTSSTTQMRKTWMKWRSLGTMARQTLKMAMKIETISIKPRTNRILLTRDNSLISRAVMSHLGKTWVRSDHSPVLIQLQKSNMHPIAQTIFHRTTKCHTGCKRTLPQTRAKLD